MLKRFFILSFFLLELSAGCKKTVSAPVSAGVPNVGVSFTIDVYSPLYPNLAVVGGWAYVTGGYDGIIIFCNSTGSYLAFDRGCPYDCTTNAKAIVNVQSSGITAVCPVCGTQYSLYSGSLSNKGPGTSALKQYRTSFDGTNLTVSN